MATNHGQSIGRTSVDQSLQRNHTLLPNGSCSYKDLNAGVQAPVCGCRRFWLNSLGNEYQEERAWCFCGHHACYHNDVNVPSGQMQDVIHGANDVPYTHQSGTGYQVNAFVAPTWSELIGEHTSPRRASATASAQRSNAIHATGLGIHNTQASSQSHSKSINTRLWAALNTFAREQDDQAASRLPSTAVPSMYDEIRPSTPPAAMQNRNMGPPLHIPPVSANENRADEYSATEVATATPSIRGTPDLRPVTEQHRAGPSPTRHQQSQQATAPSMGAPSKSVPSSRANVPAQPLLASNGPSLSIQEMCNTIQDYGRRISILESLSFSHMPTEEIQDKFDMLDARTLDLEHWRTDQDKMQMDDDTQERLKQLDTRLDDLETRQAEQERSRASQESEDAAQPSSSKKRRLFAAESSSFASDESFDMGAAAQTEAVVLATLAANAETHPRIDALESRIVELEGAALPSMARPIRVEVVLLPFGRQLPGIWFSASQSTQTSIRRSTQLPEEWSTSYSAKSSFGSAASSGAWTTESIEKWANETEDEWLSAKACGPSGAVYNRLASRGLVRDIELRAPDAHHVCDAIARAFQDVLKAQTDMVPGPAAKYLGLQERFIPLRKVRKSSRLRFLNPGEMITPAIWDAGFLESSVFMKMNDGERRLYVTTPDGYIQPPHPGWSWPSIKSLPSPDGNGELQAAQIVGDVVEACWTYNERLDRADSLHSSFASSDGSLWNDSDRPETGDGGMQEDTVMPSPPPTRPSRTRSLSLPSSASVQIMDVEPASKRRVASFDIEESAAQIQASPEYISKRRRISTSPELERRGVNFTPRWSREPPSPFTGDDSALGRSSQTANHWARGTTPFAYATPHSHFDSRSGEGEGDTEIDETDVPSVHRNEDLDDPEEWEGVQDGPYQGSSPHHKERNAGYGGSNADADEDDLDDGLTIYEV